MFNDKKIHKKVCIAFALAFVAICIISFFTINFPVQTLITVACILGVLVLGMVYIAVYTVFAQGS